MIFIKKDSHRETVIVNYFKKIIPDLSINF